MERNRKIQISIITLVASFSLNACGPSSAQISAATSECQSFVEDKMGVLKEDTHIFDSWVKDGKIVVEVGYKQYPIKSRDDSYNTRLCVYDEEKGTISLPSVLNNSEWRK